MISVSLRISGNFNTIPQHYYLRLCMDRVDRYNLTSAQQMFGSYHLINEVITISLALV
jgi:hypothetical protein